MSEKSPFQAQTAVTHLGRTPGKHLGAVNTPVYRASTIIFDRAADLDAVLRGEYPGIAYGLHGLPTVTDLQDAFAALEGGHAALAVPSGLAAITLALLAVVSQGDHVLVTDAVYGPTRRFCENQLRRFGVDVSYYDPLLGADIAREMRRNTRVVFVESPGSLTFEVQDVPAIAAVAHAHGALVIMDNTWATPLGFPAFARGVDISVHAGTKYLGGHADVLNGIIVANEATFPRLHRLWTDMGVAASPDDCFLALRGLRTLALRLERHAMSALAVARWLAEREEVTEVVFPALPGSRGHELWLRDFTGACGLFGVSLRRTSKASLDAMLDGMRLFKMGFSWGGFESLILPARVETSRQSANVHAGGPYLRLHVGLENVDDLIADLVAGFDRLRA
jgi:cysteine-S-conjugate beta-lyase